MDQKERKKQPDFFRFTGGDSWFWFFNGFFFLSVLEIQIDFSQFWRFRLIFLSFGDSVFSQFFSVLVLV